MWVEIIQLIAGILFGSTFFIVLAYIGGGGFSPGISTALGRFLWTMGSLVNGASAIEYIHGEGYKMRPMKKKKNGVWAVWKNGSWSEIPTGRENISRLGLRPFAVIMQKEKEAFEALIEKRVPGGQWGDGETHVMPTRADLPAFLPQDWNVKKNKEGWLISLSDLATRLRLGGSSEIANRSWIEALKEYANPGIGNFSLKHAIFFLLCLAIGCVFSWAMFGPRF
tara:strand:+ start:1825 stop:2496 length:672 start_codon:yes stop_codon:yes gene_type:complete